MRKRSYKSLGMDFKSNGTVASKKGATILKAKTKSKKKAAILVSHYDDNQHISLSLPESLCSDHVVAEAHDSVKTHHVSHSVQQFKNCDTIQDAEIISESQSVPNVTPYSDANNYFMAEAEEEIQEEDTKNRFIASQTVETSSQETNVSSQSPENITNQETEVSESIDIDQEADRRFEEDLKAILNQKKTREKQNPQQGTSDTAKSKDNGVSDPSDEAFKQKLDNRHAIFDQISQSMKMADTYDFGAIAMNKTLDHLEEETNEDFTQKIQDILENDEAQKEAKPDYAKDKKSDSKILTEDFLEDMNTLKDMSAEQTKKEQDFAEDAVILDEQKQAVEELPKSEETVADMPKKQELSKQSSFDSTISIKHRYLKSRIFSVTSGTVSVTIDAHWVANCADISHLNVSLTRDINWGIDREQGTKQFKIGQSDTHSWSDLPEGNYYLTFFFAANTNPHCELSGTINVVTS